MYTKFWLEVKKCQILAKDCVHQLRFFDMHRKLFRQRPGRHKMHTIFTHFTHCAQCSDMYLTIFSNLATVLNRMYHVTTPLVGGLFAKYKVSKFLDCLILFWKICHEMLNFDSISIFGGFFKLKLCLWIKKKKKYRNCNVNYSIFWIRFVFDFILVDYLKKNGKMNKNMWYSKYLTLINCFFFFFSFIVINKYNNNKRWDNRGKEAID